AWIAVSVLEVLLVAVVWAGYKDPGPNGLAFEEQVPWIPGVGSSYHVGIDGLSLPLVAMTVVVFLACAVYCLRDSDRPRVQAALFLFLQSMSLGVFVSADMMLLFVFFYLSYVGLYVIIAWWGYGYVARPGRRLC